MPQLSKLLYWHKCLKQNTTQEKIFFMLLCKLHLVLVTQNLNVIIYWRLIHKVRPIFTCFLWSIVLFLHWLFYIEAKLSSRIYSLHPSCGGFNLNIHTYLLFLTSNSDILKQLFQPQKYVSYFYFHINMENHSVDFYFEFSHAFLTPELSNDWRDFLLHSPPSFGLVGIYRCCW